MFKAMQDYFDIRTANALDVLVEQVRAINSLERNADDDEPFNVTAEKHGVYEVEFVYDGFPWTVWVEPSGKLDYTLGGAIPERARHNEEQ